MDITWEYETAAAERRGEFNQQARADRERAESAWIEFVGLFTRESVMARVVRPVLRLLRGERGPVATREVPAYSPKLSWYTANLTGTVSSVALDLV